MHTQANKKEKAIRKKYQTPVVEKIKIDTEFTYFTTSQDPVPANPGQNSIVFNPFKFFK
jgi:hypothetical protein